MYTTLLFKEMKALVLNEANRALRWIDVDNPKPKAGFALVKVETAALNHRDVWISKGLYAGLRFPIILGSDGYGKVIKCATKTHLIGKQVIINPGMNWGNNTKAHSPEFSILGLPENGTFAEFVEVPEANIYESPAHMDTYEAAALPLAGLTAWRALFSRARLLEGENILITGIGSGVALVALQMALAMNANVFVSSSSESKNEFARKLGAKGSVLYTNPEWANELKKLCPSGFDVILDSAAGNGFASLIELTSIGGRIVFFGGTAGNLPSLSPQKIFWKQLSIMGTTMGSPKEFENMLDFVTLNNIKPVISHKFPMSEGQKAFDIMANGQQTGKIVLFNS